MQTQRTRLERLQGNMGARLCKAVCHQKEGITAQGTRAESISYSWTLMLRCRQAFSGKAFKKIKGLEESILVGEDIDLTTRASKHGRFDVLKKKRVYVSVRRLEKEGRLNYSSKRVKTFFYDLTGKKMTVKDKEVEYDFGGYDKVKRRKRAKNLFKKYF